VSALSDGAIVRILLADYVAIDGSSKKVQVVGGGITILGVNSRTGLSAPFGVLVVIEAPSSLYGAEFSADVTIEDAAGGAVILLLGEGPGEPVQIKQTIKLDAPPLQAPDDPKDFLTARTMLALMFPVGLPLAPGAGYRVRLKIDGETRSEWTDGFIVTSKGTPDAGQSPSAAPG
jgi:hypothetical protein